MTTDQDSSASALKQELLELVARQSRRVPFPVFIAAGIIASFAADSVEPIAWGSWLGATFLVLVARWIVLGRLPLMVDVAIQRRVNIAIALSALNGFIHGFSLVFFPFLSPFEQAVQSMLLLSLCAGAVATTAGYLPLIAVYTTPVLLYLSYYWVGAALVDDEPLPIYFVGFLILMFGAVILGLANDVFRSFQESFNIRRQQIRLNRQLQEALTEAETASQSKTRFLASASHDLRQPIHTLSLFSAALDMQEMSQGCRDITAHMKEAVHALATQMDVLLDISKLDANVVAVNSTEVEADALISRICREMQVIAAEKGLEFEYRADSGAVINTDPVLLERILRNLIGNAIKYTDLGSVKVTGSVHEGQLQIGIEDSGCGISAEDQALIFDEFFQVANPERDRKQGLGLGLAIVKRLIRLLHLDLQFSSVVGQGTCFTLLCGEPIGAQSKIEMKTEGAFSWQGLSVLVVDDDPAICEAMTSVLEASHAEVTTANGTDQALERLAGRAPDIAFVDFRLRGKDNGLHCIATLRKLVPGLPAALISGDTGPDRLQEAASAGVMLLHKPLDFTRLEITAQQLLTEA